MEHAARGAAHIAAIRQGKIGMHADAQEAPETYRDHPVVGVAGRVQVVVESCFNLGELEAPRCEVIDIEATEAEPLESGEASGDAS
jgi:hypothetical protein